MATYSLETVRGACQLVKDAGALRERPLLDFLREVLPKLIAMIGTVDMGQIMDIIKIITDLFGGGVLSFATAKGGAVCAMTAMPKDAEIEAAIQTVLAEKGGINAKAFDFAKLLELIKLILAILFPKPVPVPNP